MKQSNDGIREKKKRENQMRRLNNGGEREGRTEALEKGEGFDL